jgi:hypothetical protein
LADGRDHKSDRPACVTLQFDDLICTEIEQKHTLIAVTTCVTCLKRADHIMSTLIELHWLPIRYTALNGKAQSYLRYGTAAASGSIQAEGRLKVPSYLTDMVQPRHQAAYRLRGDSLPLLKVPSYLTDMVQPRHQAAYRLRGDSLPLLKVPSYLTDMVQPRHQAAYRLRGDLLPLLKVPSYLTDMVQPCHQAAYRLRGDSLPLLKVPSYLTDMVQLWHQAAYRLRGDSLPLLKVPSYLTDMVQPRHQVGSTFQTKRNKTHSSW